MVFQPKDSFDSLDVCLTIGILALSFELRDGTVKQLVQKVLCQTVHGSPLLLCQRSQAIPAFGQLLLSDEFPVSSQGNNGWSQIDSFDSIHVRLHLLANDLFGE